MAADDAAAADDDDTELACFIYSVVDRLPPKPADAPVRSPSISAGRPRHPAACRTDGAICPRPASAD